MTQSRLADVLGVSVAAVSKWETGRAYPDITLLSPIARHLGCSVDGLLGCDAILSEERVMEICSRCSALFESRGYESAVRLCEDAVREQPGNPLLMLRLANVLMTHLSCVGTETDADDLTERAAGLLREAVRSDAAWIRDAAWQGLCVLFLRQARYTEALEALNEIPASVVDPEQMRVSVYYAMDEHEKARIAALRMLVTHIGACDAALTTLAKVARRKRDYTQALRMIKLNLRLSGMFDRDRLYGQDLNPYLMMAECRAEQGKPRETLDALRMFSDCAFRVGDPQALSDSPFFHGLDIGSPPWSRSRLNRCIRSMVSDNPAFISLSDDKEFQDILRRLETLPE